MLHFPRFLFLVNFQRHMYSLCVCNMIKQGKSLQTRYAATDIYDRYYIRTHVYDFYDFDPKVTSWVDHIHGIYRPFMTLLKLV